jgi:hypothetical protein
LNWAVIFRKMSRAEMPRGRRYVSVAFQVRGVRVPEGDVVRLAERPPVVLRPAEPGPDEGLHGFRPRQAFGHGDRVKEDLALEQRLQDFAGRRPERQLVFPRFEALGPEKQLIAEDERRGLAEDPFRLEPGGDRPDPAPLFDIEHRRAGVGRRGRSPGFEVEPEPSPHHDHLEGQKRGFRDPNEDPHRDDGCRDSPGG